MRAGDRIIIEFERAGLLDFTVEEFRHCLGIFQSPEHRKAGCFTPLCELYGPGPESKQDYISNFGEYTTNQVPVWMDLPRQEPRHED